MREVITRTLRPATPAESANAARRQCGERRAKGAPLARREAPALEARIGFDPRAWI